MTGWNHGVTGYCVLVINHEPAHRIIFKPTLQEAMKEVIQQRKEKKNRVEVLRVFNGDTKIYTQEE